MLSYYGYDSTVIPIAELVANTDVEINDTRQGLRHADENGGTGTRRQRSQDFLQRVTHTKNRKLSGFGPLFS